MRQGARYESSADRDDGEPHPDPDFGPFLNIALCHPAVLRAQNHPTRMLICKSEKSALTTGLGWWDSGASGFVMCSKSVSKRLSCFMRASCQREIWARVLRNLRRSSQIFHVLSALTKGMRRAILIVL